MAGLDEDYGLWLAGFADGEGSFLITGAHGATRRHTCRFKIKLRLDDLAVLLECQRRTGVGRLLQSARGRVGAPQVEWVVDTKAGVAEIAAIFDRFPLRSKKARDFEHWRQAVALWLLAGRSGDPCSALALWQEMGRLKKEMEAGRRFDGDGQAISKRLSGSAELGRRYRPGGAAPNGGVRRSAASLEAKSASSVLQPR